MRSTGLTITAVGCSVIILLLVTDSHSVPYSTVNYGEVKKNVCSPYEVLKFSEPCCEPTCDDDCSHAICRRTPEDVQTPTCVCRQGYVRHKGRCIQRDACPQPHAKPMSTYDVYRSNQYYTTARPSPSRVCGLNERLTNCRPSCVATCEKDCPAMKYPEVCIPETSCVCRDGYVRHNEQCIKKSECPRRGPLSGEYIDFEVVSLEGSRSEEEYSYRPQVEHRLNKAHYAMYEHKKPQMQPMYVRTVTNAPKPMVASVESTVHTTEKPALYPPLCACHRNKYTHVQVHVPPMDDTASHESTEEESDIVPYAPPPGAYSYTPSQTLFPPSTPAPAGLYFAPRRTLPAPPSVHRNDYNEPIDHFFGSGQSVSAQQNSAAQDEQPRKSITIWPPVSNYSTRCGCKRCRTK